MADADYISHGHVEVSLYVFLVQIDCMGFYAISTVYQSIVQKIKQDLN